MSIFTILIISLVLTPVMAIGATDSNSDFQNSVSELRAQHAEFKDARAEAAKTIKENTQARIQEINDNLVSRRQTQRKTVLLKSIDIQIAYFERMQERINNMPNISDETKASLSTTIVDAISSLQGMKVDVEAATDEEVLKQLASDIRENFKTFHTIVKDVVAGIHSTRVAEVLDKASDRLSAITLRLSELATDSKDTTALEALLVQAEALLVEAGELQAAGSLREAISKVKDAYAFFRQVALGAQQL